jgi:ribonuclease E
VLEDALIKSSTHDVTVRTRTPVALYILNQKRANLRDLERRFGVAITVEADDTLTGANYHAIERGELATGVKSEAEAVMPSAEDIAPIIEEAGPLEAEEEEAAEATGEDNEEEGARASDRGGGSSEEGDAGRRRRRRRRRRGGERPFGDSPPQDAPQPTDDGLAAVAEIGGDLVQPSGEADAFKRRGPRGEDERRRRPRGQRGERSRFRRHEGDGVLEGGAASFDSPPSLALEEQFAASEADYSRPSSGETAAPEAAAEPTPVAPPREAEAEAPAPGAEPAPEPVAVEEAPAADEPPRPRRSGWWQRARATVIGK